MKNRKIDLLKILKINSTDIISNNLNIKNLDLQTAKHKGWVVSVGDNQLFEFIRRIEGIDFQQQKEKVKQLYDQRNKIKSLPKSEENSREIEYYQSEIDNLLFMENIINVKITLKKDYDIIFNNGGFTLNGIFYEKLCGGAGQTRRNTVTYINSQYYNQIDEILMCGLKGRLKKINLGKLAAYYALPTSSMKKITTPNVCVIKDYKTVFKDVEVEWIDTETREVSRQFKDIEGMNIFDGEGLVSPRMALQWQEDLSLDYLPSAFIYRSCWIKGLGIVFDFHKFAKEIAKVNTIKDMWGVKYNLEDVDVILTESQFKMNGQYKNWQEYLKFFNQYGHQWGCARVNKKNDNKFTALNYQYLQTLNIKKEDLELLAEPTIDWIKKIATGDKLYVLLYLLGCHEEDKDFEDVEKSASLNIVKSIMYNDEILKDDYVKRKIYQSLEKKINNAKIGKILVEGSYEFAMVDPYALCEHAFGMEVKGLLEYGELFCKRWYDKGSDKIATIRSPLCAPNEHSWLNESFNEKCKDWYSYNYSGVVLNIYDTTLMRKSDADCDGDLLITTDNEIIVNGIDNSLPPITYEKKKPKAQRITKKNIYKMDKKNFFNPVGQVTNIVTSLKCLYELFEEGSRERKEIDKRIILGRFHQGTAIDSGKGELYIPPPRHWTKKTKVFKKIDESGKEVYCVINTIKNEKVEKIITDEERQEIYFNNNICANKNPYFMSYIYPSKKIEIANYKRIYEKFCKNSFGINIKELIQNQDKSIQEKDFLYKYQKYIPMFMNNCIMNNLCYLIDGIDFNLKFYKSQEKFDYNILMSGENIINENSLNNQVFINILNAVKKFIKINKNFSNQKQELINGNEDDILNGNDLQETYLDFFDNINIEFENSLYFICSNKKLLCDYLIYIYYEKFKNYNKSMLWKIFGEQIFKNIKNKSSKCSFPIKNNDYDSKEYWNEKYKLKEIDLLNNELDENIWEDLDFEEEVNI